MDCRMRFVLRVTAITVAGFLSAATTIGQSNARPLSSVVSLTTDDGRPIPDLVRERVDALARGGKSSGFPLAQAFTDDVRAIAGLKSGMLVSFLAPLTLAATVDQPFFGTNCDYIAYFGDGWNETPGRAPQWQGDPRSGWLWVNHEYVCSHGEWPEPGKAPKSQYLTFARWLAANGFLRVKADDPAAWNADNTLAFLRFSKRLVGGSWFHAVQDPSTGRWQVDRARRALRYDATSRTLLKITGYAPLSGRDHDDDGKPLPPGVVAGIMGDCSGGQTPWGTVITAEENVQDWYGDAEHCWTSGLKFVPGQGFDAGADISPTLEASTTSGFGRSPVAADRHARDLYGFLCEIDVGVDPSKAYESVAEGGKGEGHRKIGGLGRARWENATFAVDSDYRPLAGQPIVLYAGDDRLGGRVYKFVSKRAYDPAMSRGEVRALLDEGTVYVAQFDGLDNLTGQTLLATGQSPTEAAPAGGRWLELSVSSKDIAPNAAALGKPEMTVGEALRDRSWNGIGGFPSDDFVRAALYTAANKIGVFETNRPEDVEWNPRDPSGHARLYVAFTKMVTKTALDQRGVRFAPEEHDALKVWRDDKAGSIVAMDEADPARPAASKTFRFFVAWAGTKGSGVHDAACPDNLMIDPHGGLWFGTDGNPGVNPSNDAYYYLDLDPAHKSGAPGVTRPTHGLAFRIAAVPSDAEATGPCFSSDASTLFLSVQHPGESVYSVWPHGR